jgi:hypothetical protein
MKLNTNKLNSEIITGALRRGFMLTPPVKTEKYTNQSNSTALSTAAAVKRGSTRLDYWLKNIVILEASKSCPIKAWANTTWSEGEKEAYDLKRTIEALTEIDRNVKISLAMNKGLTSRVLESVWVDDEGVVWTVDTLSSLELPKELKTSENVVRDISFEPITVFSHMERKARRITIRLELNP